jgi:conjugative transfer region protein TrbK
MKAARFPACLFLMMMALNAARGVAQQSNNMSAGSPPVTDPLAKEIERCKALHGQAVSDARCAAAYKESRQRFFQPPSSYQPQPAHVDPDVPEPKLVKPNQPQNN